MRSYTPAPRATTSTSSASASSAASSAPAPNASSAPSVFDDPGCPEVPEPVDDVQCDPLAESNECGEGWACNPYVLYPSAPCEPEVFGTHCEYAGPGVQGDSCVQVQCAHGFLCVASGQGTICAELCASPGPNTCAAGFICGSVDLKGYGVCF